MSKFVSLVRLLAAGALLPIFAGGCSIASALNSPSYVDTKTELQVGVARERVAEVLGPPKITTRESPDNHLVDYHEFKSGTPGVTRFRVVGYLAGDIFTLGLAEIVFWPVEMGLLNARDYKAHVAYDTELHLTGYRVVDGEGTVVDQKGDAAAIGGGDSTTTPPVR
jgi:hypothetical protein